MTAPTIHFIVSAQDEEQDPFGMPVAELEIDAEDEAEAINKAKAVFNQQLTTLDGLRLTAMALRDESDADRQVPD
jgi:hypothetical protein